MSLFQYMPSKANGRHARSMLTILGHLKASRALTLAPCHTSAPPEYFDMGAATINNQFCLGGNCFFNQCHGHDARVYHIDVCHPLCAGFMTLYTISTRHLQLEFVNLNPFAVQTIVYVCQMGRSRLRASSNENAAPSLHRNQAVE